MALLILSSEFYFFSMMLTAFFLNLPFLCFISQALAHQMQAEEEHLARQEQEAYVRHRERRLRDEINLRPGREPERPPKEKKRSGCIIM
jgi:hypothetical protein